MTDAVPWFAYAYIASTIGVLFAMAMVREAVYLVAERFGVHHQSYPRR